MSKFDLPYSHSVRWKRHFPKHTMDLKGHCLTHKA